MHLAISHVHHDTGKIAQLCQLSNSTASTREPNPWADSNWTRHTTPSDHASAVTRKSGLYFFYRENLQTITLAGSRPFSDISSLEQNLINMYTQVHVLYEQANGHFIPNHHCT